jgi:methylated-DNA-[protein]-cysteine S-methyltransferase
MTAATIPSPIGNLELAGDGEVLTGLAMVGDATPSSAPHRGEFTLVREQLDAYFAGSLTRFDLALAPTGSPFEQRVWAALQEIPYGETESYGELARRIGAPQAARAVGLANGRNPIALVIPCHRVIGASGSLTGFGGGLPRKRFLLDLEAGVGSLVAPG